jgi:uncharacterized protein (TIGR03437 family)
MFVRAAFLLLAAVGLRGQWDAPASVRVSSWIAARPQEGAPGAMISIAGVSLAGRMEVAPAGFAAEIGGVTVSVTQGGRAHPVPLASVSPERIVAQLPFELEPGAADLVVAHRAGRSPASRIQVRATAPAPQTRTGFAGAEVVALHPNGSLVQELASPAAAGRELTLVAVGLGVVEPPGRAGQPGGDGSEGRPEQTVRAAVSVLVDDVEVPAARAILSPERAGEYWVTFRMPAPSAHGWRQIQVRAGDAASPAQPPNRLYSGPRSAILLNPYPVGECREVEETSFTLPAGAWIRGLALRARMPAAGRYELRRGEETVAEGRIFLDQMETRQPGWRRGRFEWTERELPGGVYQVRLSGVQGCAEPDEGTRFGMEVRGEFTESLWAQAGGGMVGPAGGAVSGGGLTLAADPGAYGEEAEVRISAYDDPAAAPGAPRTYYRLEGLPAQWSQPLKVTLEVPPGLAGLEEGESAVIALRAEGDSAPLPRMVRAKLEGGKLVAALPPNVQPAKAAQAREAASAGDGPVRGASRARLAWLAWGVLGLRTWDSDKGRFVVHYPAGELTVARKIAADLEDAYDLIAGMGLDWNRRQTWPIEVFIFSYSSWSAYVLGGSGDDEGNMGSEIWGREEVALCLNFDHMKVGRRYYLTEARRVAGHELLHLMQALYDPRGGRLRRTFSHSTWLWLMEASATWFERAMSESEGFTPPIAMDNWDFLFRRPLEVPPGIVDGQGARRHGYGASAFLQHLAPAERGSAPAMIGDVIKLLEEEDPVGILTHPRYTPVQALRRVVGDRGLLQDAWHAFAGRYVQAEIWSGFPSPGLLTGGPSPPSPITLSRSRPSFSWTVPIPELSARAFLIRINQHDVPEFRPNTKLLLKIEDPARGTRAFLYRVLRDGPLQLMGDFTGKFEVLDAEGLFKIGDPLYLVLANGHNAVRGGTQSGVKLDVEIGSPWDGTRHLLAAAELSLYNREYNLRMGYSLLSTHPFRVVRQQQLAGAAMHLTLQAPPRDPDKPDEIMEVAVRFEFSDLRFRRPPLLPEGRTVQLFFTTRGETTSQEIMGTSGEFIVRFPLWAHHRGGEVSVRPWMVTRDGTKSPLTGGGSTALQVTIGP